MDYDIGIRPHSVTHSHLYDGLYMDIIFSVYDT